MASFLQAARPLLCDIIHTHNEREHLFRCFAWQLTAVQRYAGIRHTLSRGLMSMPSSTPLDALRHGALISTGLVFNCRRESISLA